MYHMWCAVLSPQVQAITTEGGTATGVTTSSQSGQQQHFPADVVVLAAGVGTAELCAQLGYRLPLLHKPAAIVVTSSLTPGTLRHMIVADTVFILQVCCVVSLSVMVAAGQYARQMHACCCALQV